MAGLEQNDMYYCPYCGSNTCNWNCEKDKEYSEDETQKSYYRLCIFAKLYL